MDERISELHRLIEESERIVFFGGAGVSTESGIPDFRSVDGLYNQKYKYPPETILSRSFFEAMPEEFFRFYRDKLVVTGAKPNAAHKYLAHLEERGKLAAVITQNIDGLHEAAGSKKVLELHGTLLENYCVRCKRRYGPNVVMECEGVPRCQCGGVIRPDIVLYEEGLSGRVLRESVDHIARADLMIIGGTSLAVYPAAGLINYFRGRNLVLINKSPTAVDSEAQLVIPGKIGEVCAKLWAMEQD